VEEREVKTDGWFSKEQEFYKREKEHIQLVTLGKKEDI
jgi:hypothetical protein